MEDQLLDPSFELTQFLELNLKNVSENEDLDLQLTDMIFTLSMIQSESQEKIYLAQKCLIENQDEIVSDANLLKSMLIQFKPLINEYVNQIVPQSLSTTNKELYEKMEEIITYQSKIGNSLEMFDTIMQLDNIYEQYQRYIDDENLSELLKDVKKNHVIFQLLLELPKVNPRCEQGEKIIELVKTYCLNLLREYFSSENELNPVSLIIQDLVEIMSNLKIMNDVVECYKQFRIDQTLSLILKKVFEVYLEQQTKTCTVAYANQIISDFCVEINSEIKYLEQFQGHSQLYSDLIVEYLKNVIRYFNQNFFKRFFFLSSETQEYQPNNLFEIFQAWIQLYNFMHNLIQKGSIEESIFQSILKNGIDPYKNIIPQLIQCEIVLMKQIVFKKLNNKEHQSLKNPVEKLQDYEFQNIGEVLEQSFKRMNDLCFTLSVEDWIFECVKLLDGYLLRMAGIIDEISQSFQQDSVSEFVSSIMERIRLKKTQQIDISKLSKFNVQFQKKSKNLLIGNFQTFELLLLKDAEIKEFKLTTLFHLDQTIKKTVLQNSSSSVDNKDLVISIHAILNDKIQNSRAAIHLQSNQNQKQVDEYFSEISLVQSLEASIEQVEQKLIAVTLKLLLAEQFNKLIEGVQEEQIDQVVSQFTAHLEMIQKSVQIGQNIEHLDDNNVINLYIALQLESQALIQENVQFQKEIFHNQIKDLTNPYIKNQILSPFTLSWALLYAISLQILLQQAFKQGEQTQLIQVLRTQTDKILDNFIIKQVSKGIWLTM